MFSSPTWTSYNTPRSNSSPPSSRSSSLTPRSNSPPLPSRSSSPSLRSSSPPLRPSSSSVQSGKSTPNTSDSFSTSTPRSNHSFSRRSSDTLSSTQPSSDKAYVDFSEVLKKKPNKAEDIYSVLTSNFIPPENTWNQSIKEYPKAGIGKVEKRYFHKSMCPDGFAYSLQNKGVYCVLCSLLVPDDVLQRSGLKVFVSTPCSDWKRIKEKMKIHMQSEVHLLADTKKVANIKAFEKGVSIESFYQERLREKREKNTKVLHTLVDSVLYLAIQGLPLRGHDESLKDDSKNPGNFLCLLNLLKKYDTNLNESISLKSKKKGAKEMTSWKIQNEIIDVVGKKNINQQFKKLFTYFLTVPFLQSETQLS